MNAMVDYSVAMLTAVSDFLVGEPIIYLLSLICFLFIVKAFKVLMGKGGV